MGNALTYVQSEAEFDGHGAGQKLLARYDGFSKQRNTALRNLIPTMKHTSGTLQTIQTCSRSYVAKSSAVDNRLRRREKKTGLWTPSPNQSTNTQNNTANTYGC
jgi:hypothetical protein